VLSIQNVAKRFGGVPAIDDFSFDLAQHEFCGVIGPNGAGKTTLMNLITGYIRPDIGGIMFDGRNISGLRPYRISHLGIGRTFQVVRPFLEMTVRENVLTGALFVSHRAQRRRTPEQRCSEVLELVGLADKRDALAASLTLGEKKRLELARSLATEPRLLLLDEVLGGLSEGELVLLVEALKRVHASGTTILMIEHVIRALVQLVDRIVVLNFGRKIAEGSPEAVLSNPDVVESYLGKRINTTGMQSHKESA